MEQEWIFETEADSGNDYRHGRGWRPCGFGSITTRNIRVHLGLEQSLLGPPAGPNGRWMLESISETPFGEITIVVFQTGMPRRRFRRPMR